MKKSDRTELNRYNLQNEKIKKTGPYKSSKSKIQFITYTYRFFAVKKKTAKFKNQTTLEQTAIDHKIIRPHWTGPL